MAGPNDMHMDNGVLKSGLGPDEPSIEQRRSAAESAAELKIREEALATASAEMRSEALSLEQRRADIAKQASALEQRSADLKATISADFDAREAELQRRETDLAAKLAAAATATDDANRKVVATQRAADPTTVQTGDGTQTS